MKWVPWIRGNPEWWMFAWRQETTSPAISSLSRPSMISLQMPWTPKKSKESGERRAARQHVLTPSSGFAHQIGLNKTNQRLEPVVMLTIIDQEEDTPICAQNLWPWWNDAPRVLQKNSRYHLLPDGRKNRRLMILDVEKTGQCKAVLRGSPSTSPQLWKELPCGTHFIKVNQIWKQSRRA